MRASSLLDNVAVLRPIAELRLGSPPHLRRPSSGTLRAVWQEKKIISRVSKIFLETPVFVVQLPPSLIWEGQSLPAFSRSFCKHRVRWGVAVAARNSEFERIQTSQKTKSEQSRIANSATKTP